MSNLWNEATDLENPERAEALKGLMDELWNSGETGEAIQVGYVLLEAARQDSNVDRYFNFGFWVASRLCQEGNFQESLKVIDDCLSASEPVDDVCSIAYLYWQKANTYSEIGNEVSRIENLKLALEEFQAAGEVRSQAAVSYALADALENLGFIEEAKQTIADAIDLYEQAESPKDVASSKCFMGRLLFESGHYKLAQKYYEDSKAIYKFLRDKDQVQISNTYLGRCSTFLGQGDLAERLLVKAAARRNTLAQQKEAAEAGYYLGMHWIIDGQNNRGLGQLVDMVPVLRALGLEYLAVEAEQTITKAA